MSPRRSSRARTTQPMPGDATALSVASSSASSSRGDRATRSIHKQASPHKSATPHSLSSEERDELPLDLPVEPPLTRRRTREQGIDDKDNTKTDNDLDDEITEEDEVTRCVCAQLEYPGPPLDSTTHGSRTASGYGDDAGGLFIQCDICKVWQHGGCVGIMDEASSPDEYFCEECRKDLHKLMTSYKGQKYSRYLPVYEQLHGKGARKVSVSKEVENKVAKEKDRSNRASAESFSKRRSTMNSRAAYDEDEVLRKVLEESKHEGPAVASDNGNRKKRSRDDSEEIKSEVKRQRTGSKSRSASPVLESDDDTANSAPKQKPRGAAARSQREKEIRDKERERAEAANRRKGRAERRKGDEPDMPDDEVIEEPGAQVFTAESVPPETPTLEAKPAPVVKKGGRPPQKRQSRLGRNQYSKDVPSTATNGVSPTADGDAPASPQLLSTNGTGDSSDGTAGSKPSKSKHWRLQKLSWNDIRRPAGIMQDYIATRQVEMAKNAMGAPTSSLSSSSAATATTDPGTGAVTNGVVVQKDGAAGVEEDDLARFKTLSTLEMMDRLDRDLARWQQMAAVVER